MFYGIRDLEFDFGEIVVILDVVCIVCYFFIIEMYEKYCKDIDFLLLLRVILFCILYVCLVFKWCNFYGLDNIIVDGFVVFKFLCNILKNLEFKGIIDKDMKFILI